MEKVPGQANEKLSQQEQASRKPADEPVAGAERRSLHSQTPQEQAESQKKLHDLLAGLWEQRKGILLDRLRVLQESIADLEATGSTESRKRGAETAHKLAGILGTFGLPRGTDLAREAEVTLEQDTPLGSANLARLHEVASELGLLIDHRSLPNGR